VEVVDVERGGPAEAAGIHPGDRLVAVGSARVRTVADLMRAVHALEVGETVSVTVGRGGTRQSFGVDVAERPPE
jgi:S1-C subfamily serine protease